MDLTQAFALVYYRKQVYKLIVAPNVFEILESVMVVMMMMMTTTT